MRGKIHAGLAGSRGCSPRLRPVWRRFPIAIVKLAVLRARRPVGRRTQSLRRLSCPALRNETGAAAATVSTRSGHRCRSGTARAAQRALNGSEASELRELLHALPGHAGRRFLGADGRPPGRPHGQGRRHLQRDRRRQPAHGEAARARRPGGRPRGQDPPARALRPVRRRLGRDGILGQFADRRSACGRPPK